MARQLGNASIGLASELGLPPIDGVDPEILSFPALTDGEALTLVPQDAAGDPIDNWALFFDVYIPQPSGTFTSLLQTGDGDGDLFLRDNGDGTAGIGIDGVYEGAVSYDAWNRIVVSFTEEGGETILRKFVNGASVGIQNLGTTARWQIDPAVGLKLFADNDGETSAGAVASIFFSPTVPSPADLAGFVATIPAPSAAGFFPASPLDDTFEIDFANEDLQPRYGTAEVRLDGFGFQTPVSVGDSAIGFASQLGVEGPSGEDIPVLDYAAFTPAEGILADVPGFAWALSSYTAVWDLRIDEIGAFQSLLRVADDGSDGELFIRGDGGLGINGDYDGTVVPGEWTRIAITVEDQGDGTALLSKYLDGAFLDAQTVSAARFTLFDGEPIALLTDNDRETGTGYLAHFGLSEEVLDAAAIAALGGADGDGPFEASATSGQALTLTFDSHWRPFDQQTAQIFASYDGGAPLEIFRYDSTNTDDTSQRNETVVLDFVAPSDAQEIALSFRLSGADNDWYWALDNIRLEDDGGVTLLEEDFEDLDDDLANAVDEATDVVGWTHTAPDGWSREVDPDMPAGTTEWRGWSFVTPEFWQAADGQARGEFTKGTGVIAVADGDEWDDFNGGQAGQPNSFDSTFTSPTVALSASDGEAQAPTYQLGFDGYAPTAEFGFESVAVVDEVAQAPFQDNIADRLVREGAPDVIDLAQAFGPDASGFSVTSSDGDVIAATIEGTTLTLTPGALGHSDITVTAIGEDGTELTENFRAIVAGANAYVFAIMPDTQDYTSNPAISETFGNMTDWLIDQRDALSIQHMIHVGDIVQFGAVEQWEIAQDAIERLDGELSYTLNIGNHDQQRPGFASAFSFESDVDTYFTPEQVGATAAQGGGLYDGFDVGEDTFANGDSYADSIRNHYTTLTTPDGTDWLILSLEFGMPDDVLRWASEVIEAHLDHRVIIDTHSWNGGDGRVNPTTSPLTTDNGGWGYAIRDNPRSVNDGEDAWRELASKYPNIAFTFNGHNFMGGAETVVSYAAGDNPVHQMFVNYQNGAWAGVEGVGTNGGNGALRLVVIDPDNDRFTTHTKLVELDTYYNAFPDHEETFEDVDLGAPEQIAIAKAGGTRVVAGPDGEAVVTLDASATLGDTVGARYEWFAADGERLAAREEARVEVTLGAGVTDVTLVVTDRFGNVSTDTATVIVEDETTLLVETFNDGDLDGWQNAIPQTTDFVTLGTDTGLLLPAIDNGSVQIPLTLTFDSHWRPFDNQTGTVLVSFDGGAAAEILRYDGTTTTDTDQRNETISVDFLAPGSASTMEILWRYDDADNDWYWAIDNIAVAGLDGATPVDLFAEDFDGLAAQLQPAADENIDPAVLGWTHTAPAGWSRTVDPNSPQGATEWRGWSFVTPEFWQATASQARAEFIKGTGVIAVADGDEWDDFNGGAGGNTDSLDTTIGTPAIDLDAVGGGSGAGTPAGVLKVDPLDPTQGLLVTPSAGGTFAEYTIVFDILAENGASFAALYQTDVTNAGDANIYLRDDGATYSIGISGDYDGAVPFGDWARVALVYELQGTAQVLSKYVDGVLLGTQVVDTDVTDGSRWTIDADTGFLLFSEPNGFTSTLATNAIAFTPDVLTESEIAALGGVDVDGPLSGSPNAAAFQFNFDGALGGTDFGAASLEAVNLEEADTSYLVKGSIFGNPDGEGEAALYAQSNGPNEILVWGDDDAKSWSDYVFEVTVEPADNDTIGAVFYFEDEQNHYALTLDQENDERILTRVKDGVSTELARESGSYRHFAPQELTIAVVGETITITLDGDLLFDGPVTDPDALAGGTVGVLSRSMDRAKYDNIAVNEVGLTARALGATPTERWAVDLDGDGKATVNLTAAASLSASGLVGYAWLVDGEVVATGENAALDLAPGTTTVALEVTDGEGDTARDEITVEVANQASVLAADDFDDGDFDGWTIVDEGTIDAPSDWSVVGGALVQASDIQSTDQQRGSTGFSVDGDGPDILRDGTYALWNAPQALSWTDYALEATLTPNDDDGIGLLLRYSDPQNYYKLEADAETGLIYLTKHEDGYETVLARGWNEYTPGEEQRWRIEVEGGVITAYIDGAEVFGTEVDDRALPTGTVGLYSWGSTDLAFDDVVVTDFSTPAEPATLDVFLVDADTDQVIAPIENGGEILRSDIVGRKVSIGATVPETSPLFGVAESALVLLNEEFGRLENVEPYALFGDIDGDFNGRRDVLREENSVTFDIFSKDLGRGYIETITRDFTLVDDLAPQEGDLRIVLVDAHTDDVILELTDGIEIDADLIDDRRVNIAAFIEDETLAGLTESVAVSLNDGVARRENFEPYALFGDARLASEPNYFGRRNPFEEGENTVSFELFSRNNLRGEDIGEFELTFALTDDLTA